MSVNQEMIKQHGDSLLAKLPKGIEWQPDQRFDALIAEIPKPLMPEVSQTLKEHFSQKWNNKNIKKAPKEVKQGAGIFADMERDQLLFGEEESPEVMAAWWPWGPGAPASLRIFVPQEIKPEKAGLFSKLFSFMK
ncbi:hypothetical protein [Catenovulum maritimum]|uniref:Uncharacterized protein n=1 Tax=Catenovulum maritimum TaxID=1513271 RepID=A0A0J8GTG0_9ALTE|nr:hypothetical protein [Catenovulum maritimum]KMT66040.1 hypothetical protein XM47_06225 [Catenovulum maritimum]